MVPLIPKQKHKHKPSPEVGERARSQQPPSPLTFQALGNVNHPLKTQALTNRRKENPVRERVSVKQGWAEHF